MKKEYAGLKKATLSLLTVATIASQLMGCGAATSSEFLNAVNSRQAIEVMIEMPEDIRQGTVQESNWIQLDKLDTYADFRRGYDDALGITNYGEDSKNGILYVDLEGKQEGNNTLYNGFANNKFRSDYWNNDAVQLQVQKYAEEQFADVEAGTEDAKMAALNAYYNLFSDAEPNYFNGSSVMTRGEFMAGLFKAETPVGEIEEDSDFISLVGGGEYAVYAQALAGDSYLDIGTKSLNDKTFDGVITRGEAVYMLVSHYFGDELATASGKSDKIAAKNAGDIAGSQGWSGDYSTSYELVYAIENIEEGVPEKIYKALEVAYGKGILSEGEADRWEEGLTKSEAIGFIAKTYLAMPSVHGLAKGSGEGIVIADGDTENKAVLGEQEAATSEVFTEEEEAIVEQEVEQGLLEVPEEVAVKELDTYLYATTDVSLREGASVGSEKLGTVMTGTKVHAIGQTEDNQWIKVEGIEGKEGFISSAYLQETAPTQDEQVAVQQQQEQQAELEQQAQANQEAQAAENKSQAEAQAEVLKVLDALGATDGTDLANLPSFTYVGNQATGEHYHAE